MVVIGLGIEVVRFVSIAIVLALAGCANAASPPSPEPTPAQLSPADPALIASVKAEREAATMAALVCLKRAARRLDDHKSDPMTIAHGMLSACGTELDQEVKVYSKYIDLQGREKVTSSVRQSHTDAAIQMILENRKARR